MMTLQPFHVTTNHQLPVCLFYAREAADYDHPCGHINYVLPAGLLSLASINQSTTVLYMFMITALPM